LPQVRFAKPDVILSNKPNKNNKQKQLRKREKVDLSQKLTFFGGGGGGGGGAVQKKKNKEKSASGLREHHWSQPIPLVLRKRAKKAGIAVLRDYRDRAGVAGVQNSLLKRS